MVDVKRRARHTIAKGISEHGCQNLRPHRNDNEEFQRWKRSPEVRGIALLNDSERNHDTAFAPAERRAYGIEGLLPHAYETLDRQAERALRQLDAKTSDLEKYIYLISLADTNETLFYCTVMSDPARFIPILYDPTVADACAGAFGHIDPERPRGECTSRAK